MGASQDEITDFLNQWSSNTQGSLLVRLIGAVAVLLLAYWLIKFFVRRVEGLMDRANMDPTLHLFLARVLRYGLYALAAVIVLSILGVPTASIVGVLVAAALAIGLALQDSLKNIASGVLIIILQPYEVGHVVEINDRVGVAQEVGLFHTHIRTQDNKILLIPNSEVMNQNIINFSKLEFLRVDMVFRISYDDNISEARQVLQEIVNSDARILKEPEPIIAVKELGENGINLAVQPYAKLEDALDVRYYVTEQVKLRFDEAGISIPVPRRDIRLISAASSENGKA
jgi:small conductance mechanosensitive channel